MDARNLLPKEGERAMLASPIPRDLRVYIDQVTGLHAQCIRYVPRLKGVKLLDVSIDASRQLPDSLVAVKLNF
jgi:hypothetical protein